MVLLPDGSRCTLTLPAVATRRFDRARGTLDVPSVDVDVAPRSTYTDRRRSAPAHWQEEKTGRPAGTRDSWYHHHWRDAQHPLIGNHRTRRLATHQTPRVQTQNVGTGSDRDEQREQPVESAAEMDRSTNTSRTMCIPQQSRRTAKARTINRSRSSTTRTTNDKRRHQSCHATTCANRTHRHAQ